MRATSFSHSLRLRKSSSDVELDFGMIEAAQVLAEPPLISGGACITPSAKASPVGRTASSPAAIASSENPAWRNVFISSSRSHPSFMLSRSQSCQRASSIFSAMAPFVAYRPQA